METISIKDRLLAFIQFKGLSVKSFEKESGLSNGFVSKTGKSIREASLKLISLRFPELNLQWLEHGIGQMCNPSAAEEAYAIMTESASSPATVPAPTGAVSPSSISPDDLASLMLEIEHLRKLVKSQEEKLSELSETIKDLREDKRLLRELVQEKSSITTYGKVAED